MEITKEQVLYIAKLAKLRLDDQQAEKMREEFEAILGHFQSIDQIDSQELAPEGLDQSGETVLRRDELRPSMDKEKLFQNAKQRREGYLQVPKIIE